MFCSFFHLSFELKLPKISTAMFWCNPVDTHFYQIELAEERLFSSQGLERPTTSL